MAEVGARDRDGCGRGGHRTHHSCASHPDGDGGVSAEAFEGTLTDLDIPSGSLSSRVCGPEDCDAGLTPRDL